MSGSAFGCILRARGRSLGLSRPKVLTPIISFDFIPFAAAFGPVSPSRAFQFNLGFFSLQKSSSDFMFYRQAACGLQRGMTCRHAEFCSKKVIRRIDCLTFSPFSANLLPAFSSIAGKEQIKISSWFSC